MACQNHKKLFFVFIIINILYSSGMKNHCFVWHTHPIICPERPSCVVTMATVPIGSMWPHCCPTVHRGMTLCGHGWLTLINSGTAPARLLDSRVPIGGLLKEVVIRPGSLLLEPFRHLLVGVDDQSVEIWEGKEHHKDQNIIMIGIHIITGIISSLG